MSDFYFGFGLTLAAIVNFDTVIRYPPQVLPNAGIPLVGPIRTVTGSGVRFDGSIDVPSQFDVETRSEYNSLIYATNGDFTVGSIELYVTWIDERGFYSPFLVEWVRPIPITGLRATANWVRDVRGELRHCRLQYLTKTGDYTVTTSDRLIKVDTSGASRTMTLPALAGVTSGTVYSFEKTSASNSMILDGSGAETVDTGATLTRTSNHAWVGVTKDTATNWKVVDSYLS